MCLYIASGPHVAEHPIPVFKVIKLTDESQFEYFQYQPNKEYTTAFHIWGDSVNSGFHAFRYGYVKMSGGISGGKKHGFSVVSNDKTFDPGIIMSFVPRNSQNVLTNKLVAFTIPKGATYYIGTRGDIVSDKIRSGSLKPMRIRDLKRKRNGIV